MGINNNPMGATPQQLRKAALIACLCYSEVRAYTINDGRFKKLWGLTELGELQVERRIPMVNMNTGRKEGELVVFTLTPLGRSVATKFAQKGN